MGRVSEDSGSGHSDKGDTAALFERLRDHAIEDDLFCLWQRFTWFGFFTPEQIGNEDYDGPVAESLTLKDALNMIESVAIHLAMPRHNLRKECGFSDVKWYYQPAEFKRLQNTKRGKN